jgi:Zn2+/Cd2+-exporting ATPase
VCSVCGEKPGAQVGSARVVVKDVLGSTLVEKQRCSTAISFWKWVALKWPKYAPREHKPFAHGDDEWKPLALLAAGCLILGILGALVDRVNQDVAWLLYVGAYLCGGWDAAIDAWERLRKARLDVHFLMLAVAGGAALIGAWREGALLLFLFSASGAMEHYAMGRTRREISVLFRGAPKTARVLRGGSEEQVTVASLEPGMRVIVTSGEQISADLEVLKGETACDESSITGESVPIRKEPGDVVLSGTMNLWGAIEGRVLRRASESALQRIINLIQEAQDMKAPSQKFTDKFGTGYTWAILTLCTLMFFIWWIAFDLPPFLEEDGRVSAFYRAMTLLVVASPCALVLSVPSSILSAIASGARRGILFRGGAAVETLADVNVVALDKTGTLTTGELTLKSLECLRGEEERLKQIAWTLARLSQHPLSRAIRKMHQWASRRSARWLASKRSPDRACAPASPTRLTLLEVASCSDRNTFPPMNRAQRAPRSGLQVLIFSGESFSMTRSDRRPPRPCKSLKASACEQSCSRGTGATWLSRSLVALASARFALDCCPSRRSKPFRNSRNTERAKSR